jgi:hypothetical protein
MLKSSFVVHSLFDSLRTNGDPDPTSPHEGDDNRNTINYAQAKYAKRTRTVSPTSAKHDLEAKRLERERQRRHQRATELDARRKERDARFLDELYADFPDIKENGKVTFVDMFTLSNANHRCSG